MCISPIRVPNPNQGKKVLPGSSFQLKDCTSAYIDVPCGVCEECIAVKQMSLVQRVQMESLNHHIFFATLTYQESELPRIQTSTGYSIRYTDVSDLQKMFKRLRISDSFGRPFRYFAVSELGGKRGRPHAHILFLVPRYPGDDYNTLLSLERRMFDVVFHEWRRNYGTRFNPDWHPLSVYVERYRNGRLHRTYDLHYVQPYLGEKSFVSVAFYVLKYMLKPSKRAQRLQQALHLNLDPVEYEQVWSKVRPRYFKSFQFGDPEAPEVISYLKDGIRRSLDGKSPYPCFFNVDTGQTFPLSRYYKGKGHIYDLDTALSFRANSEHHSLDNSDPLDPKPFSQILKKVHDYEKKVNSAASHGVFDGVLDF